MKLLLKITCHILWFVFLTLLTQIGGLVWYAALYLAHLLPSRYSFRGLRWLVFLLLYSFFTVFIVPPVAKRCFGRVPLPAFGNPHLQPENILFSFFNRTYVKPELHHALTEVAEKMQQKYPGSAIWFLDANFPFIDGYPLEPHLSHRDGKKVDLCFYWKDAKTGKPVQKNPSPHGYGLWAEPLPGEFDYAEHCINKGYWYIALDGDVADWTYDKNDYVFDGERTREMLRLLAEHPAIGKILIQPHLKTRLKLGEYGNIRAQGCHAARHDDHAHVQLK